MHARTRIAAKIAYITLGAMLGAMLFASQVAMAGLPNIEIVSLLILVWTRVYRTGALPGIAVFIALEGVVYGFGIWWISYLYIWFILWGIVMLIPPRKSREKLTGKRLVLASLGWAILNVFTLGIGNLFLTPYMWSARTAFYRSICNDVVISECI